MKNHAAAQATKRLQLRGSRSLWANHMPWWVALVIGAVLLWSRPAPVSRLDLMASDLMTPSHTAGAEATVLAIDDESLATIGRWPKR